MNKRELVGRFAGDEDERIILARVLDQMERAAQRSVPCATQFLSPAQRAAAEGMLDACGVRDPLFFGGYEGAERTVCVFLPDYLTPEDYLAGDELPIGAVEAAFPAGASLTHRDMLGSLMGLGLTRDRLGDILLSDGRAQIVAAAEAVPILLSQLSKAGRYPLRLREIPLIELSPAPARVRLIHDTVAALRLDAVAAAGCPVEMVLDALSAGQLVCAGMAGEELCTAAAARGLVLVDYFQREDLTVMNAVATAEGAIQLAMEELPVTLCGARALVVGFGRIGRLLAPRLAALGAEVTAAARRGEQRALARAMGLRAAGTEHMARILHSCTLAVNTAPAMVLGREELAALPEDALVIDLASPPGGVDFAAARALGVNALWARGLPGRVAPVSAAGYIRDAVYHIMEELGV